MRDGSTPQVLRINDPLDLVEAIPHLLGFEPAESLVAVALVEPRERMHFALRLDLPGEDRAGFAPAAARMVAAHMQRAGAVGVVLAVFTADPGSGVDLPHRGLVDAVGDALDVPLREALLVTPERFWSYLCSEPRCCPVTGKPRDRTAPGPVALAAAHALRGRAVLPNREAAVAAVAAVDGVRAWQFHGAAVRAEEAHFDDGRRFLRGAERLLDEVLRRYAEPPAEVTVDEAAQLAVAMGNLVFRDRLIVRCIDDDDGALRRLVTDIARLAQPPSDAAACAVLGCAAYFDGDGLTVMAAVERALLTDPTYSLALLLRDALARQVPPDRLRTTWRNALPNRAARRAR